MLIRTSLAAAVAAISLALAGNAAAQTDVLVVEGTTVGIGAAPLRPLDEPRLKAQASGEQGYMKYKLEDVLVSHPSPTQSPNSPGVPPNPASTGLLKFEGGSGKPAIAINTPLRTVISGSPVADGSTSTLMAGEKLQRQAPSLATPTGRR